MVIGLDQAIHQVVPDHVIDQCPRYPVQPAGSPFLHHQAGQHFGAKGVMAVHFLHAVQPLDAQAQVVQFPAGLVQDGLNQARRQDGVLNLFVADQRQQLRRLHVARHGDGRRQGFVPPLLDTLLPARAQLLKGQHRIAPLLHVAGVADLIGQRRQPRLSRAGHLDENVPHLGDKLLARLARQQ